MTNNNNFTAYVLVKWKIIRVTAQLCANSTKLIAYRKNGFEQYAHSPLWQRTLPEAIAKANEMRVKKIASLKKQIAKLEKMVFE